MNSISKLIAIVIVAVTSAAMSAQSQSKQPVEGFPRFAIGADLSSMKQTQTAGKPTFYKGTTVAADQITTIPEMAFDYGLDAIRLRVWVNPNQPLAKSGFSFKINGATTQVTPTGGFCGKDDLVEMARTFAMNGHRIMVVFQMSDTWADPARQFIPSEWASCTTADQLAAKISTHVTEVLTALRDADVNVAWVQIGNETNTGMLKWQMPAKSGDTVEYVSFGASIGSDATTTTKNFVNFFTAAANAARAIYPEVKTVIHLANGANWDKVNWTLNLLKRLRFNTDICDYVGLSLYPCDNQSDTSTFDYTAKWRDETDKTLACMENVYSNYGFRTLLCEIGMNNEYSKSADMTGVSKANEQKTYIEQCNRDVRNFTEFLMAELKDKDSSVCDGLFYWDAATDYLNDYKKGACYSITPGTSWPRNRVTANDWWYVCAENSTFPAGGLTDFNASIQNVETVQTVEGPVCYYNLLGQPIANPQGGIFIRRQGSSVSKVLIR